MRDSGEAKAALTSHSVQNSSQIPQCPKQPSHPTVSKTALTSHSVQNSSHIPQCPKQHQSALSIHCGAQKGG